MMISAPTEREFYTDYNEWKRGIRRHFEHEGDFEIHNDATRYDDSAWPQGATYIAEALFLGKIMIIGHWSEAESVGVIVPLLEAS